jgi:hypothetical protein
MSGNETTGMAIRCKIEVDWRKSVLLAFSMPVPKGTPVNNLTETEQREFPSNPYPWTGARGGRASAGFELGSCHYCGEVNESGSFEP